MLTFSFPLYARLFSPAGKWGSLPMNGQVSCEGPMGKTSLFDMEALTAVDPATYFRKDDMSPKVNPADVKKAMNY
jgi:NADH dehydrogenase (ubiquinone) flavoprotein 2